MARAMGLGLVLLALLAGRSMVQAYTSACMRQSIYLRRSPLKILTADDMMVDEDSAELIKTLQLQMVVPPKEVTNRIKSFFSSNNADDDNEKRVFVSYIKANINSLDMINIILLLEGCNRQNIKFSDILTFDEVGKSMEKKGSYALTSKMVHRSITLINYVKSSYGLQSAKVFVQALWKHIFETKPVVDTNDICPSLFSLLQSYDASIPEMKHLLVYLSKFLVSNIDPISPKSLCSVVYALKKLKYSKEIVEVITAMTSKIRSSETFFHPINICIAMTGLQSFEETTEVKLLMDELMNKSILATEQGNDQVSDREISMALFGMQKMSKGGPEVRRVLKYIGSLLQHHNNGQFEAKRLGFCLTGITCLSSDIPEVDEIINELSKKSTIATGNVSSQELSMILHGITNMDSDKQSIRKLLKSLVSIINNVDKMTAPGDVSSGLSGLQKLHSNNKDVTNFIRAIINLLKRSEVKFTRPYEVSTTLYGLQGLGTQSNESRELINEYMKLFDGVKGEFSPRELAMSIYGLKNCDSNCKETFLLLDMMKHHVSQFKGTLSSQDVATIIYSLQRMRSWSDPRVLSFIREIAPHIRAAKGTFNPKGLSMAVNGLQGLSSSHDEVRELVSSLNVMLLRSYEDHISRSNQYYFEDFHQVSSALRGLSNLKSDSNEIKELLTILTNILTTSIARLQRRSPEKINVNRVAYSSIGIRYMQPSLKETKAIVTLLSTKLYHLPANSLELDKDFTMMLSLFNSFSEHRINHVTEQDYHEHYFMLQCINAKLGRPKRRSNSQETEKYLRSCLQSVQKLDKTNGKTNTMLIYLADEFMANFGLNSPLDTATVNTASNVLGHIPSIAEFLVKYQSKKTGKEAVHRKKEVNVSDESRQLSYNFSS